jgi:hypothetical protein
MGILQAPDGMDAANNTIQNTDDWLLHPQFKIWPPKCRRAILWTLEQVILFHTQQIRTLTLQDFMDFLHRSRWKMTHTKKGRDRVGNYLSVLD